MRMCGACTCGVCMCGACKRTCGACMCGACTCGACTCTCGVLMCGACVCGVCTLHVRACKGGVRVHVRCVRCEYAVRACGANACSANNGWRAPFRTR